jgi:deoxyribodipyrimidine photo-lyase
MVHVVWFKRDLRIHDHRPLAEAAGGGDVLALYVLEPALWRQADRSGRHWLALQRQLRDLDAQLQSVGLRLWVIQAPMTEALDVLQRTYGEFRLMAHEETGSGWTYRRDRAVIDWCRENHISFDEQPQFGVVRALASRDGWAGRWDRMMGQPLTPPPSRVRPAAPPDAAVTPCALRFDKHDGALLAVQPIGRRAALAELDSFLKTRGAGYRQNMSSPLRAQNGGSRLSVHLSLGTLSMREVWQATRHRRQSLRGLSDERRGTWPEDLTAFEGRLHWHCHFIQKLESEPRIEFENLQRATAGLRPDTADPGKLSAWCNGETGWPFVDACMRYLHHNGWINFRMRAMLMSVASYQLWLPWRATGLHLARQFVDYEPGIHWSQVQMQSGTTGINRLRIYNPVKQSLDQDPHGRFIARWVPELRPLPAPLRHQPWQATPAEQRAAGVEIGRHYPDRVVDHAVAARAAQAAIRTRRRQPDARAEAASIHAVHGSRRRR